MSKVGKQPVEIPVDVEIEIDKNLVSVTGPKGAQSLAIHPQISVELVNSQVLVKRKNDAKIAKALHGLTRTLIYNMVVGVTKGWEKIIEVSGTGFGVRFEGGKLILKLGFSHLIEFTPPKGIATEVSENKIKITGANKAKVGEIAAKIRAFSPPNPYSGKGIRYLGEKLKLKPGKAARAVGGIGKA